MHGKNAAACWELGKKYFKSRRFKEAVEQFQEYIWLNPNDPAGHHSLGMTYCELGEFSLAVDPFLRALRLGPEFAEVYRTTNDPKLHHLLGQVYLNLGRRDEALREHEILKSLGSSLADALAKSLDRQPSTPG